MNMTSPTCKFLRSYTGIWQGSAEGFFPPFLPLCFDFSIEKCHWSGNPPWLSSPSVFSHWLHALKVLPSLSLRPYVHWPQGLALHHLLYQTSSPWLCFISSSHVILLAHNYQPSWRLETLWKFLPPIFQPWRMAFGFFLPVWGWKGKRN